MTSESPKSLGIVKTLSSKPRLEALLLLFIYRKMSLTKLSKSLQKTKNTMIYHMDLLKKQGLIKEFDQKLEHSIKPIKIYELSNTFYETLFVPFEDISTLPKDQVLEHSKTIFRYNNLLFETIREILLRIRTNSSNMQKEIRSSQDAIEYHQDHATPRDLIPLSEKAYKNYMHNYEKLKRETLRALEEEDRQSAAIERPYLAFNTVLPIKDLFESPHEPKE